MASTKSLIDQGNGSGDSESPNSTLSKPKDSKYSWFVCACGFITQVFIIGVLHAFGVFFIEIIRDFNSTKAKAAWIGSLAYGLSMTFGPLASILVNRFGNRAVMVSGGLICAASVFGSSFVQSLPQLFGSFSVLYGIGTCMATSPTMTIAPTYFDKYMAIAVGLMTAGSSVGTLVMAPLSQALVDEFGWRNTFRFFAGTCLFSTFCCSLIKPLQPNTQNAASQHIKLSLVRSIAQNFRIWKNRVFLVWTSAITCVMFGFYIPYVHLVSYAVEIGISPEKGSIIVMLLGACTAIGRMCFGKIVQLGILNRLHMHQVSMVITGTGVMMLPFIKSFEGIMIYVVIMGLIDGCFVVLLPVLTTVFMGVEDTVLAWGFLVGTASITFMMGPPVAGALFDAFGSYDVAFHCAGLPVITGAVILFLIPWAQRTSEAQSLAIIISEDKLRNEYDLTDDLLFGPRESMERVYSRSASVNTINSERARSSAVADSDVSLVIRGTTPTRQHRAAKYKQCKDQSTSTSPGSKVLVPVDFKDVLSQLNSTKELLEKLLGDSDARNNLSETIRESAKSRSALVQSQNHIERNPTNVVSIMSVPCGVPSNNSRARCRNPNDPCNVDLQGNFGQDNLASLGSSLQSRNLSDFLYQVESPSLSSYTPGGQFASVSACQSSEMSSPVSPIGRQVFHCGNATCEDKPGLSISHHENNDDGCVDQNKVATNKDEMLPNVIRNTKDRIERGPLGIPLEKVRSQNNTEDSSNDLNVLHSSDIKDSAVSTRESNSGITSPRVVLSPQLTSIPEVSSTTTEDAAVKDISEAKFSCFSSNKRNSPTISNQVYDMEHWLDNSPNQPLPSELFASKISLNSPSDIDLNETLGREKNSSRQIADDVCSSESSLSRELDVFTHLFNDNDNID